ncbi:hypothetical protein Tco_0892429 [Tanacetum coccineum]|uniref:Uncharacterized protein n=1 Tax=Tanacetum coccineum TaxID=301880 RepID=A0ABQ5C7P1_9ASTR
MKICFSSSQIFIVPDDALPSHRLAIPIIVKGKTHSMMSSSEIPGVLNKLAISRTLPICLIASSISFPEKCHYGQEPDNVPISGCSILPFLKLAFMIGERSKHLGSATPSHD